MPQTSHLLLPVISIFSINNYHIPEHSFMATPVAVTAVSWKKTIPQVPQRMCVDRCSWQKFLVKYFFSTETVRRLFQFFASGRTRVFSKNKKMCCFSQHKDTAMRKVQILDFCWTGSQQWKIIPAQNLFHHSTIFFLFPLLCDNAALFFFILSFPQASAHFTSYSL